MALGQTTLPHQHFNTLVPVATDLWLAVLEENAWLGCHMHRSVLVAKVREDCSSYIARNAKIPIIIANLCFVTCSGTKSRHWNLWDDFAVSANMAYGEVKLDSTLNGELHEEPDRVVQFDQGHYDLTEHPAITDSPPTAPVYDTVEGQNKWSGRKHH